MTEKAKMAVHLALSQGTFITELPELGFSQEPAVTLSSSGQVFYQKRAFLSVFM